MRAPIQIGAAFLVLAGAVTAPAGAQHDPGLAGPVDAPARAEADPEERAVTVPVFREGRVVERVTQAEADARGLLVLDIGDGWVPSLFRGGPGPGGALRPHRYEDDFVRLARGEHGEGQQFARARQDRFLELYGIPPTLGVLRERFLSAATEPCGRTLDFAAFREFAGSAVTEDDPVAVESRALPVLEPLALGLMVGHDTWDPEALPRADLDVSTRRLLEGWERASRWQRGMDAIRQRLACDGHLRGRIPSGPDYDRRTRAAVAELERRHRIYARGRLNGATLTALRTDRLELERRAVVRMLAERAMLAAGYVEDGSTHLAGGQPATHPTADGERLAVRDLDTEMREWVEAAFGLGTVESTLEWLHRPGTEEADHERVAFEPPPPPEYYGEDMELSVEIDRGDVWFDFPVDERGRPRFQPVERRPILTLYVTYLGERIPLIRYGTTIGGWRLERAQGELVWRYKESPTGPRIWTQVVSAPVWIPPPGTPDGDLVTEFRQDEDGSVQTEVKSNLVGPGYASAYGLVAAYHLRRRGRDTVDEGIRTHGSVDYTSVWRRASHGCHRLHNHLALRLFTFLLAHRPHVRLGHRPVRYRRTVSAGGFEGELRLDEGGYRFELARPVPLEVLRGRIRGGRRRAPRESHAFEEPNGGS